MRANSEAWQKLSTSWWMEEQFLESVAERRLDSHLKECLLNCLPNDKKVRSMDKALLGCRTLVTGPVTSAAPKNCERELSSCVNLLQDMVENRAPTAADLTKMNQYAMTFVKKCEPFATLMPEVVTWGKLTTKRERLFGKEAIDYKYEELLKDNAKISSDSLKIFRQFKWLLNDAQLNDVDRWIQKALVDAKGRMSSRKALEDNKKSRPTPAMSSAGSSKDPAPSKRKNSDGVAAEVDGKTAKTPKEAVTEDDVICEEPSGASGLLSFFGAKAL